MQAYQKFTIPCGFVLLAVGVLIRYHIGKRRFKRRNGAGLQQFPSYGRALWVTVWERLAMGIANLLTAVGGFLLAVAAFTHLKF